MPLDLEKIDLGSFGVSAADQPEPDTELRSTLGEAIKVNPDSQAKINQLSRDSGMPAFAVEQDPAPVESNLKLDQIDFSTMSKRSPNTAQYLTDFNRAAVAHDDIDILESIESVFDFSKVFENFGERQRLNFSSSLKGLQAAGVDAAPMRIQDLVPASAMPIGMEMEALQISQEMANRFGINTDEELQEAKQQATQRVVAELQDLQDRTKALTPEDLNLLEQGVLGGFDSIVQMSPGIATMVISGGRAAPLLTTMGIQTFGGAYGDARADGLDPETAAWYAGIDAAIEVGTEMLPTGTLERIVTGKSEGLTKEALKFVVQEMGTEQIATLGQSINAYAFGLDEQLEQAEDVQEMLQIQLQRQAVTAIATVVAGGTQAAAASTVNRSIAALTRDQQHLERKGEVEQEKIDQLNEAGANSKLKQRDVEAFKEFIETADGEQNTNIFIDGAQVSLYLAEKSRSEIEKDPALKLLSEQVDEASRLGTDVAIPAADFAATVAGTPHFDALRADMTLSADSISPFRAEQVQQETRQYVQSLMNQAQENVSQYVEAQDIYETVRTQLIDTGMVTPQNASTMAQLVPAWATVHAQQNGMTVQEVYQRSGLTIEGPQTGRMAEVTGQVLEQRAAVTIEDQQGTVSINRDGQKVGQISYTETADTVQIKRSDVDVPGEGIGTEAYSQFVIQKLNEGKTVTSDNVVSDSAQRVYDKLAERGFTVERAPETFKMAGKITTADRKTRLAAGSAGKFDTPPVFTVSAAPTAPLRQEQRVTEEQARADLMSQLTEEQAALFTDQEIAEIVESRRQQMEKDLAATASGVDTRPIQSEIRKLPGVEQFDISADPVGNVVLNAIKVRKDEREKGAGTAAITSLIEWADRNGKVLALTPSDSLGGNKKRLTEFYKRFGFIENKGRNKDFEISESMYRPVAATAEVPLRQEIITKLPDRTDIYRMMQGIEGTPADLIRLTESVINQHDALRVPNDPALTVMTDEATGELIDAMLAKGGTDTPVIYSEKPDKTAIFWDDKGNVYRVIRGNLRELSEDDGIELTANTLSKVFDDIRGKDPRTEQKRQQEAARRKEEMRRQRRLDEIPKVSPDFDTGLQEVADWAENFEEFQKALSPSLFDISDRNRTRLGRARMALPEEQGEYENAGEGDVTVYRAMPEGQEVEAGDWVSFDRKYAAGHETNVDEGDAVTAEITVPGTDVWWYGADESEWVYIPKGTWGEYQTLKEVWDDLTGGTKPDAYPAPTPLAQRPDGAPEARGYYDPANAVIRLTEAADLSTFLHEFAHFMYEMERKAGGETSQKIGQWFKRNADEVAKEANSYLADERDALGQQLSFTFEEAERDAAVQKGLDMSRDARLQRARQMGFDTSREWYHGTSSFTGFTRFNPEMLGSSGGGRDTSLGVYHARSLDTASAYTGADAYEFSAEQIDEMLKEAEQKGNREAVQRAIEASTPGGWSPGKPGNYAGGSIRADFLKTDDYKKFNMDGAAWDENEQYRIAKQAKEEGFKGVIFQNMQDSGWFGGSGVDDIALTFDTTDIRDTRAAFDPEFEASADLLAQSPEIPGQLEGGAVTAEDVVAFVDNDTTGDKAKDQAIYRAVHEQFARGFETYLMEGKAPSIELRNAFRSFARWLAQIYRQIKGQLNVNLDAEMRQVFDRMLATEEQIAAAEARARYEPMFTDAAMAGMTDEEFAAYQKRQEKVKDKQTETLRDKLIKEITRQTETWWKEEKADLIAEETDNLRNEPVYTAAERLRSGDIKLDRPTVKAMVGEQRTDKLGRKTTRIPDELRNMTAPGGQGIHPDEAAAFFGYNSGDEMLTDLITAPKLKDQAESNAERRMREQYGDILNDGTIEQQADEAVQNEERGKLILDELKALSRGTGQPAFERQTIKALAEERIGQLAFREIFPAKYRKAEIKAAQEAARMLAEGNREGAARAKARQVLNYYLGMAATEAKNGTLQIVDRMSRYNTKRVREEVQKAEGGYWDQIVRILERFEFRKSATLKEVESLNTWVKARIEQDGDGLVLSPAVLNESFVTHWKNVPYADLQGVADSVKNIEHVARYANKITRLQEEMDFKALVNKWVEHMDKQPTVFTPQRTDVIQGRKWGRWFMSQMTKVPFLASWLDGGERAGLSHDILVQPFTDAYSAELTLWKEVGAPVLETIEKRDKATRKRHMQKVFIPEIKDNDHDGNLFVHQIVAVALNTGNRSNLKKMLLGEGWADPKNEAEISFDNAKLQAVLKHLTRSDWQMVQEIWDQMDKLYPQLAEVHRRTTGLTPPKVEATPVETEFGTFRGGYYPVKYDPNRSHQAQQNEDKLNAETESMFGQVGIQASVNASATNERTGYYAPIRLSLDVVPAHFQETIHYITHHDAVREANRLIRNKSVADAIRAKVGPDEYSQLRPWLNDIAKDGREAPAKMFWDDMLGRLRFGVTLGAMGFKASTGIMQLFGLSNTVAEVGLGPVMQSMRTVLGTPSRMRSAWEFAREHSKVLEFRAQTMDREIKNAMKRLEGKQGIIPAVQEASMKHIALIQTYMVDMPSWHAAYTKGMSEWGDEQRAFQYADWVIENVQGSGATKDLARIMRGQSETGRMFTMFMTFFSSLWNIQRDLARGARSGRYSVTNVAAKMAFLFFIPVFMEMLMRGEFGGDDEEPEAQLQKYLTNLALYPAASVPFMRDVASGVLGEYGYNFNPLAQLMETGVRTIPELVTRPFTDEDITKGQWKGGSKFVGAAVGIPGVNQAWATSEHLYEVLEDGEDLTLRELLFGPDRD